MKMEDGLSSKSGWTSCPQCHRPKPENLTLCKECQVKKDLADGIELARGGDLQASLGKFRNVCGSDGMEEERAQAYYYTGVVLAKMSDIDKAAYSWRKCLELEPMHPKAKKKLTQYVLQKPRRKRDPFERQLVEGSEFDHARPAEKRGGKSLAWARIAISLGVVAVIGILAYLFMGTSIRYFTYTRHVEQVRLLVSTGQVGRAFQYFNDQFKEGDEKRREAEQELLPDFKRMGMEMSAQGENDMALKLLRAASDFDPDDMEIRREIEHIEKEIEQEALRQMQHLFEGD